MKFLVLSDLHGSLPAARTGIAIARSRRPDAIILLGDIICAEECGCNPVGYDPFGVACELRPYANRIIAVKGNCEEASTTPPDFPLASEFAWIMDEGIRIHVTHGHIYGPENLPPLEESDVLLFGHTHMPTAMTSPQGIHLCNPGSLALPQDGHPASYGWLEYGTFSVYTAEGELYLQLDCV